MFAGFDFSFLSSLFFRGGRNHHGNLMSKYTQHVLNMEFLNSI